MKNHPVIHQIEKSIVRSIVVLDFLNKFYSLVRIAVNKTAFHPTIMRKRSTTSGHQEDETEEPKGPQQLANSLLLLKIEEEACWENEKLKRDWMRITREPRGIKRVHRKSLR
jgi:hypothetical protein